MVDNSEKREDIPLWGCIIHFHFKNSLSPSSVTWEEKLSGKAQDKREMFLRGGNR